MARTVHATMTHLDAVGDAARGLAHVGERLKRCVVRRDPADVKEQLLDPRLEQSHDLGRDFPDLIILYRTRLAKRGQTNGLAEIAENVPVSRGSG